MDAQPQTQFTEADIDTLGRLFERLAQWGSWERLLVAASPETLTGRPP